jgi:hypothetical protein
MSLGAAIHRHSRHDAVAHGLRKGDSSMRLPRHRDREVNSNAERTTLAEIGKQLAKQVLKEIAKAAKSDTILV